MNVFDEVLAKAFVVYGAAGLAGVIAAGVLTVLLATQVYP